MAVTTSAPTLKFALGFFVGVILADVILIGADVLATALHWWAQR